MFICAQNWFYGINIEQIVYKSLHDMCRCRHIFSKISTQLLRSLCELFTRFRLVGFVYRHDKVISGGIDQCCQVDGSIFYL